ncbi:hypothetical protein EVAR_7892_1 [Eumeta japonica]|uniref:Uncharacterized protein n=1 Tax=Eumeta variegata TaxID=151549 RepID=A0A4C1TV58_EUMVA|nr:hypothetical protein EVAR_7892_1 [Eumeta japonica]
MPTRPARAPPLPSGTCCRPHAPAAHPTRCLLETKGRDRYTHNICVSCLAALTTHKYTSTHIHSCKIEIYIVKINIDILPSTSLPHEVRAAPNLNSRRLRDASAASAAPDLMNRGAAGGPGRAPTAGRGRRSAAASSARISDARVVHTPYVSRAHSRPPPPPCT